jgi:hypothetical protein
MNDDRQAIQRAVDAGECFAPIRATIKTDTRRGTPFDGKPSGRGGKLADITAVGLAKVSGQDLGIGNPMTVSEPPNDVPKDFTGVSPQKKTREKKPAGEKGVGPIVKSGQSDKSPSEQVGQDIEQTSQLHKSPFDSGAKPKKLSRKKGEGNPGEEYAKDVPSRENLHVNADKPEFTREQFNRLAISRYPSAQTPNRETMTDSQRAFWNWSQR